MNPSTEIINKAKERFEELKHKGFNWKSFYNGFLEGCVVTKELYGVYNQDDRLLTVHVTEGGAEEEMKTHGDPFGKYFYVDKVTINL